MPSTTPIQAFRVPITTDNPDVVDDMTLLAKGIEKRVMGVYANATDRNTFTTAGGVEEGMFAYLKDTNTVWYYTGSAWTQFPVPTPAITSGTSVPSNASGVDGDIFFKV